MDRQEQKALYARMEQQRVQRERQAQELRWMAMEELLSRRLVLWRRENELLLERNAQAKMDMEQLKIERLELEKEVEKIRLEEVKVARLKEEREKVKREQKEFEARELASSPIDDYNLDIQPVYENFDSIIEGAQTVMKDLEQFQKLRATKVKGMKEAREDVSSIKTKIETTQLVLRNLERSVKKAKTTGTVARAGFGTVRVVPITPIDVEKLEVELSETKEYLERLQSSLLARKQELKWIDRLLQQLCVLVERNEGFRREMMKKLKTCLDVGSELVLCAREDGEKLEERMDKTERQRKALDERRVLIEKERREVEMAKTEFFDTKLRVEGTFQRVKREAFKSELDTKWTELEERVVDCQCKKRQLMKEKIANDSKLQECASKTYDIEVCLNEIKHCGQERPEEMESLKELQTQVEEERDVLENELEDSLSEHIRRKKHADRSEDEKAWIGLDFVLHFAHYYKVLDRGEVDMIQKMPEYIPIVRTKEEIGRLLALPGRNSLAFAFIKTQAEMKAHRLLRKFTCGDGEDYYRQLDTEYRGKGQVQAKIVDNLNDMRMALDANPAADAFKGKLVALQEQSTAPLTLVKDSGKIVPHQSTSHCFSLPQDDMAVLKLTISVVFQGHFRLVGYENGRLSAALYVLPEDGVVPDSSAGSKAGDISGYALYEELVLNSAHNFGRLVLHHDPVAKPLSSHVVYQIVLGAPVLTSYSIQVQAHVATFADAAFQIKRHEALKYQEEIPVWRDEIENLFVTMTLSERKKRLAKRMMEEAQDAAQAAELALLKATNDLEKDNQVHELPPTTRLTLQKTIGKAQRDFERQCTFATSRANEMRDIEMGLTELTVRHAEKIAQCRHMETTLSSYRTVLPDVAAALVPSEDVHEQDAAGASLAKDLDTEYECRGARSSKVRWAELAAMRAKLPSMMTPAERVRRKYKKNAEPLEKAERLWVIIDRIRFPKLYEWESQQQSITLDDFLYGSSQDKSKVQLGNFVKFTKEEEALATLSKQEVDRILNAPWNSLERKEMQIRKIVTKYKDEHPRSQDTKKSKQVGLAELLRAEPLDRLSDEEKEWRMYDKILHPSYYPKGISAVIEDAKLKEIAPEATDICQEDLIMALDTKEEDLYKLPSRLVTARNLLIKYDSSLHGNLAQMQQLQHQQVALSSTEIVQMDIDARCRLVYLELQRAIANTQNEFMDSSTLHTTVQRFPTKALRLELEKELDRLLISQITEREAAYRNADTSNETLKASPEVDDDSVSESDSDEEAQIAREKKQIQRKQSHDRNSQTNRGKSIRDKTLQKQRRQIQDALRARSVEEKRFLLEQQQLGPGGCMGCKTNPCVWQPYLKDCVDTIRNRIEALEEELERVKNCPDLVITSTVCISAVKSGDANGIMMRKTDMFEELTLEKKTWRRNLKLKAVDEELHETFRSTEEFFETKALHDFTQLQRRDKVQKALQREHNVLVAELTAREVIEDVLDLMLEGWYFGSRESHYEAVGFVPSIKKSGPLTMQDLRVLSQNRLEKAPQVDNGSKEEGAPKDKWKPIEVKAMERQEQKKAVEKGSDMDKSLVETEQALKFGIFCLTLMYFRGLSMLRKQKTQWKRKSMSVVQPVMAPKSKERIKMEAQVQNVRRRQKVNAVYEAKAKAGAARKARLEEEKRLAYRSRLIEQTRKAKREHKAAIEIQKMYRGHLGMRAGKRWMVRRREIDAQRALDVAAAITLQRIYRGRMGRKIADEKRVELAEFILQMRAEEMVEEEDEYWRTHRTERIARQIAAFLKKQV